MRRPTLLLGVLALSSLGCVSQRPLLMDIHFTQGADTRASYREPVSAVVVRGARLRHQKPAELLNAANENLQALMSAGRSVVPGDGVVVLSTLRTEQTGGSSTTLVVVMIALECTSADLDKPGSLKGCKGYAMRVPRQWPGEVYGIGSATVSLIPEGGTAHGRLRAKSDDGPFVADFEGELVASILEITALPAP